MLAQQKKDKKAKNLKFKKQGTQQKKQGDVDLGT
jgi:hypothetical protein